MKTFTLFILFGFLASAMAKEQIELTPDNVVVLRGEVTSTSIDRVVSQLLKHNPHYLYIDTNGGSVMAGNRLIELLLSKEYENTTCIADKAYSMGFAILQACTKRFVLSTSTVMQHQPSLGYRGDLYPMANYMKMIHAVEEFMIDLQSKKIGLSHEELRKKTDTEWWLFGKDIIDNNVADEVVSVKCSKDLVDQTIKDENTSMFFGKKIVTYSGCPLIHEPIKVQYED